MCNNIISVIWKSNCNVRCLNLKQIGQPPKSRLANGQPKSHTKIAFFFQKECGQPYNFLCLADWLTLLTYDDSFVLFGLILTQDICKTFLSY